MLIIHDNELIHTDNFDDVIQHFGIKGMKWGNRKSKDGVPRIGQFSGRINKNLVVRNKRNRKIVGGALGAATAAAMQYQLWKATDPQKAAFAREGVKFAGKAAKYGAKNAGKAVKKAYNIAKYNMGGVAKRKYL